MTHKCCVRDCEEVVKETRSRGLPLHKFPKDPLLRAKWLTSGGFEPDFKPTSSQIVCYRHFLQSDYEIGRSHKLFLKKGSVPSIFADYQAHPDPISPTSAFITSRLQAREVKLAAAAAAAAAAVAANASVPAAAHLHPACVSDSPLDTSCSSLEASMDSSNSLHSANAIPLPEPAAASAAAAAAAESQLSPQLACKTEQLAQPPPQPQPQPQPQSKPADPSKPRLFSRDLNFATGDRLEAKDFNEKWYSARVVETDWVEREVLIHFDKWSSRFDEWIPMDSSRLRALQPHKEPKSKEFAVGERILATWGDGKKYPAKVNAALDNDRYDVLFDDGYAKILKASKMTKLVDAPVNKLPEDSDYVGSKQERRDKKRKHKVTELFAHHSKKKVKSDPDKAAKKHDVADVRTAKSSPKVEPATATLAIKPEAESRLDVQQNDEGALAGALEEDYATFIGNLRVEIDDSMFKCPKTGCIKNFRKENLLLMHIKHYHPEYCKYLGSTPNVADLAYARTIGESVEDVIPKKSKLAPSIPTPHFHGTAASAAHATLDSDFHQVEVDNNKLEGKLSVENNSSPLEDNSSEQSNSCTMSPGTLFDMRFKEERTHTGIKTLPPVRQPSFHQVDDSEPLQYSNVASDDQKAIPTTDKEKKHRKRQLPYYCDSIGKVKKQGRMSENEESFDQYDDSLQDVEDVTESSFKCTNTSNNRLEMENNDSIQSKTDGVVIINGEMIKVEKLRREEIINCTCCFTEEDGLMIQCDLCLCWQHGHCNGIEKETDVPEKYVCYICQHSYRQRASKKYIHNQDWLKEGKLPSIYARPVDPLKGNERAAMLKRSSDLIAGLLQIQALLHSLRVKVNIAQNKDHPKLYLWAKNWSKVNIPTFNNEPVPIMEIIKAEKDSDSFHKGNTKEKAEFAFSVKDELDEKLITSDTELMKILEEDSAQTEEPKPSTRHTTTGNFKDSSQILLDALTRNGLEDQDQQVNNHNSPVKQNSALRYSSPEKSSKFQNTSSRSGINEASISQPVIPEPEAPIDPIECKLRLLEHIGHIQNYVDTTLTFVETQISALEDMSSEEKKSNTQHIQTKQTIQMLLHDLESVRKIAALC